MGHSDYCKKHYTESAFSNLLAKTDEEWCCVCMEERKEQQINDFILSVMDDTERPDYEDSSGNEYNDYKNSELNAMKGK